MSDESKPPSSVNTGSESTSSSNDNPITPLRDYIDKPVASNSTQQQPLIYAPNTSIPSSLRTLALLFFITGGTASILTWLYKTIIYPRLLLTVGILTKLSNGELNSQIKLLEDIKNLTKVSYFKPTKVVEEQSPVILDEKIEVEPSKEKENVIVEKVEEVIVVEPDEPPVLAELRSSLQSLKEVISKSPSSIIPTGPTPGISNHKVDLSNSLTVLNDYIMTEKHASLNSSYRSYGLAAAPTLAGGEKPKTVAEAVSGLKTEIRVVKGALLNRRNFTGTQRVEV